MPLHERENAFVENIGILPGDGVAGIRHRGPFVVLQVGSPGAHQRRRRKEIGVGRHDEHRHRDGGELGEGVRRPQGLGRGARLLRMLLDLDPSLLVDAREAAASGVHGHVEWFSNSVLSALSAETRMWLERQRR